VQTFRYRGIFPELSLIVVLILLAGAIRFLGVDHVSGDYRGFIRVWSKIISAYGGLPALAHGFADYNVPYIYILTALTWLSTHTPVTLIVAVKTTSVVFDVMAAYYAGRIVGLHRPDWRIRGLATAAVLLLPTVVLNSSYWAQCDSIYTAFTVAGIYHLLRNRPWWGVALLGVSLAFKLQAIFVFPALLVLLLVGRIRWRHLLVVPAVYVVAALPAWIAGRPFSELMMIYVNQTGRYKQLTMGAPSIYAYVDPGSSADLVRQAGTLLALAVVLASICVLLIRRVRLDRTGTVLLFTTFSIMVPFLLPGMHERYFYTAEVLAVVAAFWLPRKLWYVPVLLQAAIVVEYLNYLFAEEPAVDLRILTLLVGAAMVAGAAQLIRREPEPEPEAPPQPAEPARAEAREPEMATV
jgi:Gpi18-like mannosyltransferase